MIIGLRVTLYIEASLLALQKLIFVHLRTSTLELNLQRPNLKMGKTLYSIAGLKAETFRWLFRYLFIIIRVGESEFDIYMRMDTNTNGHRQWFYFSVKNLLPGSIKFNVYRFKKKFSLFQRGMKPYVRSLKAKENWKPGGTKIMYRC